MHGYITRWYAFWYVEFAIFPLSLRFSCSSFLFLRFKSLQKKERNVSLILLPLRHLGRCKLLEAEDTQPSLDFKQAPACNIVADIRDSRIKDTYLMHVTLLYPYFLVQWWDSECERKKKRKESIRESRECFSGRAHKSKRKALGSIPNRKLNDITRFYVIIQFSFFIFFIFFFFTPFVSPAMVFATLTHASPPFVSPSPPWVSIVRSPFDFSSFLNCLEKTRKQVWVE